MYLLVGDSHMECGNYEDAIQSFKHARTQLRPYPNESLVVASLASYSIPMLQFIDFAHCAG